MLTEQSTLDELQMLVGFIDTTVVSVGFGTGAAMTMDDDGVSLVVDSQGRITGRQRIIEATNKNAGKEYFVELDVSRQGETVSGQFTFTRSQMVLTERNIEVIQGEDVSGVVLGAAISGGQLASTHYISQDASWDSTLDHNKVLPLPTRVSA